MVTWLQRVYSRDFVVLIFCNCIPFDIFISCSRCLRRLRGKPRCVVTDADVLVSCPLTPHLFLVDKISHNISVKELEHEKKNRFEFLRRILSDLYSCARTKLSKLLCKIIRVKVEMSLVITSGNLLRTALNHHNLLTKQPRDPVVSVTDILSQFLVASESSPDDIKCASIDEMSCLRYGILTSMHFNSVLLSLSYFSKRLPHQSPVCISLSLVTSVTNPMKCRLMLRRS